MLYRSRFLTGVIGGDGAAALNNLLIGGAQFLMNLSKVLAQPPQAQQKEVAPTVDASQPVQTGLQAMIGRDMTTEKTYLKIPLPEAEAMDQIVSGLDLSPSGMSCCSISPV